MTSLLKSQVAREIIISLAVITAYRLLVKIPLPFLNLSEFNAASGTLYVLFLGDDFLDKFSIAALGIMPFVSAYILVEVCSLFIPFLKKHREGDYDGRKVLYHYALILTIFISAIQGKFIIQGIEGMLSPSGLPILELRNNLQYFALLLSLVATVFVLLLLAEITTKHGIGNGISLLILSGTCLSIFDRISSFFTQTSQLQLNFFSVTIFSLILFFAFVYIPILLLKISYAIPLRHDSDRSFSSYFMFNSCLSGKTAIGYATSILMLPATLISFTGDFEFLANSLSPGTWGYYFFAGILVVVLSYLFGWLFLHPGRRFETLKSWGWNANETQHDLVDSVKRKFLFLHLPWSLFLCCVLILPSIMVTGFNVPFYLGGASLVIVAFLSLDIIARLKLWNEYVPEKTYKIAEFQDVHHATMIKNHLKSEDVKFYLQGYYHRHLLFFFGPYIPINLMVPVFEKDRVTEIINRYYGGLGLIDGRHVDPNTRAT